MMNLNTYRCCGCGEVFSSAAAVYTYKKTCICKECNAKLRRSDGEMQFFCDIYNDRTYSPFYYSGLYREIFLRFKFNGCRAFGHILGMAAGECLSASDALKGYDCIVPVPLSKERLNERGYNQSEIMAQYVAEALGTDMKLYLERIKHGPAQSGAVGLERTNNVKGSFRANTDVNGKRLILFDDIHTTGSTLNECENALRDKGAAEVCYVTAAYVYRPPKSVFTQ